MNARAYWLLELVAWPAAAWCALEAGLRAVINAHDGLGESALLGVCAAGLLTLSRWRRGQRSLSNQATSQ